MSRNYYTSGEWNLICDVCSKKIKAGEAKKRWDGLIVCPSDFEHRHPQDYIRAKTDKITVPFTRPRPPDLFVDDGNRTLVDTLVTQDKLSFVLSTAFNDRLGIVDAGQDYIDLSYFASDYLSASGFSIEVYKGLQDNILFGEYGNVLTNPYIDATYFNEQYVGSYMQF